ncbi:hypothetical protein H310_10790, partial [Aphanomyces invadans]
MKDLGPPTFCLGIEVNRLQDVSQTVDQVLDEAIAANEASAATIKNQAAQMADALKTKRFDLAELTTLGCIDVAWRN